MMHETWGGFGMSTTMWLLVLLPLAALALASFALLRMGRGAGINASQEALPTPAAAPVALAAGERRLLDEDEQRVYDLVVARSGDVPQGDLVPLSGFSKAKLSRVLDRLERKGLLLRLRRGMGNRVVVPPAKQP